MPFFGVKCDKFLYTPTTLTVYPSSMLFWEWHNLQKKLGIQFLQENGDFVWRVSECEELVGLIAERWSYWIVLNIITDRYLYGHQKLSLIYIIECLAFSWANARFYIDFILRVLRKFPKPWTCCWVYRNIVKYWLLEPLKKIQ